MRTCSLAKEKDPSRQHRHHQHHPHPPPPPPPPPPLHHHHHHLRHPLTDGHGLATAALAHEHHGDAAPHAHIDGQHLEERVPRQTVPAQIAHKRMVARIRMVMVLHRRSRSQGDHPIGWMASILRSESPVRQYLLRSHTNGWFCSDCTHLDGYVLNRRSRLDPEVYGDQHIGGWPAS
jgi:hypothetical protein